MCKYTMCIYSWPDMKLAVWKRTFLTGQGGNHGEDYFFSPKMIFIIMDMKRANICQKVVNKGHYMECGVHVIYSFGCFSVELIVLSLYSRIDEEKHIWFVKDNLVLAISALSLLQCLMTCTAALCNYHNVLTMFPI